MANIADYNFEDEVAMVRVDFNVTLNDAFEITDDNRMRAALRTINKITNDGGIAVLMTNFGRAKDREVKFSLKPLVSNV